MKSLAIPAAVCPKAGCYNKMSFPKFNYRADIDGLRALAVISVIIFHFNHQWISGGFIGVDVFFIISGFIITSAIYPQMILGKFSFNNFYVKRIKRILPLFYLVAIFSFVLAYLLFTPNDFIGFANSLKYASTFISNIYFERSSGYFAPTSETMPLLHTWSLSIEEQFYLIWPICLIIFSKLLSKKQLSVTVFISLFLLVFYSQQITLSEPSSAYYLIQTRGFELLFGAQLAVLLFIKKESRIELPPAIYQLSGIIGLIMLLGLFYTLTEDSNFPGYNAAFVALASVLIIFSGENKESFTYKLFSKTIFVYIGKLSYSLYLWHWPILAFYRYYNTSFDIKGVLICGLATILLSFLSWRFVETPLRYIAIKKRWVYLFYLIIPIILSATIANLISKNEGYGNRLSQQALQQYEMTQSSYQYTEQPSITLNKPLKPYLLGNVFDLQSKDKVRASLWGDSHAGHFQAFVDDLGKQYQFTSSVSYKSSCPPLLGSDRIINGQIKHKCTERNNDFKKNILNSDIQIVFLAARWAVYTETTLIEGGTKMFIGDKSDLSENIDNSRRAFKGGLERSIAFIIKQHKTPVLFKQVPAYPFHPSNCWIRKTNYNLPDDNSCNIKQSEVESRQAFANNVIDDLSKKHPELIVISPMSLLCDGSTCMSKLGDILLYKDSNHLNAYGSKALLNAYLQSSESNRLKTLLNINP